MSRSRHAAVAAITFGVTLGAGMVAENRAVIEARLGLSAAPSRASTSVALAPPAVVAVADPARLPAFATEIAGPTALAQRAPATGPAPAEAIAALAEAEAGSFDAGGLDYVVPISFEEASPTASAVPEAAPLADACAVTATAAAAPAAMLDLVLAVPCAAGGVLTLHHEGLMIRVAADASGAATLRLPALASPAVVMVEGPSGEAATASALVPDLMLYDRAVLQWQAAAGPQMHAREFGAAYDAPGDVWAGAPGEILSAVSGQGGFLVALGDPSLPAPMLAEVYTYPTGASRRAGSVDLTVEAQVTAATCGRTIAAQTIQILGQAGRDAGGPAVTVDLDLPMPGCEATGEWLVLDQMLADLSVASL